MVQFLIFPAYEAMALGVDYQAIELFCCVTDPSRKDRGALLA